MFLKIVVKDRFDRFGDRFNIFLWFYIDIIAYYTIHLPDIAITCSFELCEFISCVCVCASVYI